MALRLNSLGLSNGVKSRSMSKCKICKSPTTSVFNIRLTATPICERCAENIFLQQATWYVKNARDMPNYNQIVLPLLEDFKKRRLELNKSLRDVAALSGVSASTISRIENGRDADYNSVKLLHNYYKNAMV